MKIVSLRAAKLLSGNLHRHWLGLMEPERVAEMNFLQHKLEKFLLCGLIKNGSHSIETWIFAQAVQHFALNSSRNREFQLRKSLR